MATDPDIPFNPLHGPFILPRVPIGLRSERQGNRTVFKGVRWTEQADLLLGRNKGDHNGGEHALHRVWWACQSHASIIDCACGGVPGVWPPQPLASLPVLWRGQRASPGDLPGVRDFL